MKIWRRWREKPTLRALALVLRSAAFRKTSGTFVRLPPSGYFDLGFFLQGVRCPDSLSPLHELLQELAASDLKTLWGFLRQR